MLTSLWIIVSKKMGSMGRMWMMMRMLMGGVGVWWMRIQNTGGNEDTESVLQMALVKTICSALSPAEPSLHCC